MGLDSRLDEINNAYYFILIKNSHQHRPNHSSRRAASNSFSETPNSLLPPHHNSENFECMRGFSNRALNVSMLNNAAMRVEPSPRSTSLVSNLTTAAPFDHCRARALAPGRFCVTTPPHRPRITVPQSPPPPPPGFGDLFRIV